MPSVFFFWTCRKLFWMRRLFFGCPPQKTTVTVSPCLYDASASVQVEEGLALLEEALAALETGGRGDLLAEVYRLKGVLLLRQASPDTPQAEACLQQALAVARRQQAKSWELRAALSLSRLWQRQ